MGGGGVDKGFSRRYMERLHRVALIRAVPSSPGQSWTVADEL